MGLKTFYIYAHYDLDGIIRYIGKGKGNRAFCFKKRNVNWQKVFSDNDPKVVILEKDLTELEAFALEKKYIFNLRKEAACEKANLVNICDGGKGGASGERHYAWGKKQDPLVIQKLMAGKDKYIEKFGHPMLGKKRGPEYMKKLFALSQTPEALEKRSKTLTGRKHTIEHRSKLGRPKEKHHNWGKKYSDELKDKMSKAHMGVSNGPHSEETKRKISEARLRYYRNLKD